MATDLPSDLWVEQPNQPTWKPPLDTAALEVWLRGRGLGPRVAVLDGPDVPASDPGTLLVVTWLPGAGLSLEGVVASPGFQVRTVGPQGNRPAALELAERVDTELVLRDAWPAVLGGRYVVDVRRSGGEPAIDRFDQAQRAHYVCTYIADVEAH